MTRTRFTVNVEDEVILGVRSLAKQLRITQDALIHHALCCYLQGFELLILNGEVSTHRSHQDALRAMAGKADWHASADLENRSFEGTKGGKPMTAKIVRVEVPR